MIDYIDTFYQQLARYERAFVSAMFRDPIRAIDVCGRLGITSRDLKQPLCCIASIVVEFGRYARGNDPEFLPTVDTVWESLAAFGVVLDRGELADILMDECSAAGLENYGRILVDARRRMERWKALEQEQEGLLTDPLHLCVLEGTDGASE